jgi:hypothetical protein
MWNRVVDINVSAALQADWAIFWPIPLLCEIIASGVATSVGCCLVPFS